MKPFYWFIAFLARFGFGVGCGVRVAGVENIPKTGAVILASNHRSNYDPPLIGGVVPRELHYFAKEELFRKPWMSRFMKSMNAFPVHRGQLDRRALTTCCKILSNGGMLIFFPEGTRAPEDGFLEAKLGIGWLIWKTKAPVLPVYVHGSTVDGPRLKNRPAVRIVFGKPVEAAVLLEGLREERESYQIAADRSLELIRELSLSTPDNLVQKKGPIYTRDVIKEERLR